MHVLVSSQFDGARGLESLKKSGENVIVTKHEFEHAAEALKSPCGQPGPGAGFGEIRSDSHFPTKFSRWFPKFSRWFPLNSHLLERVGGFRDRIGQVRRSDDPTTKVRRVDFGDCGPAQPPKSIPRERGG